MHCRAVLLKSTGLTSEQVGLQTDMTHISVNFWVKRFESEGIKGLETRSGRGCKSIMDCSDDEAVRITIENDRQSVMKANEAWQPVSGKEGSESTFRTFICAEGYVPLDSSSVERMSERGLRLHIFGMIDRTNRYEGFSTTESMTAEKIADFPDRLSMRICRNTFVVLDNASVHRCRLIGELRPIWERLGLFIFFLPPYSPHLNIAETLWGHLKGKWLIILPQTRCCMQPIEHWLLLDLSRV